jgi:hypothetical protein
MKRRPNLSSVSWVALSTLATILILASGATFT